jgi:hypothetical protein
MTNINSYKQESWHKFSRRFFGVVDIPEDIPDKFFIYNYDLIKKYQRNTISFQFAKILYDAIIAEIVFLFLFTHKLSNIHSDNILFAIYNNLVLYIDFLSYPIFLKIYVLPICITLIFLIWRAKNFLLYEVSLDIDTEYDKFMYMLTPILFSIGVYISLRIISMNNTTTDIFSIKSWLFGCFFIFLTTFSVNLKRFISIIRDNKYRIRPPRQIAVFDDYNIFGYVNQLRKWLFLLTFETIIFLVCSILMFLSNYVFIEFKVLSLLVIINPIICFLVCYIVYSLTSNSKSVRPISIESYKRELSDFFNSQSYGKENNNKSIKSVRLQYKALQYLKKKEVKEVDTDDIFVKWKKEVDVFIENNEI